RYWVQAPWLQGAVASPRAALSVQLHPLLHLNSSQLSGQRFSSRFTGEEFFLNDHVVQGSRVLPGVAYLEMARAAVASSLEEGGARALELREVVWLQPLVVAEPQQVHIALTVREAEQIEFEVYTQPDPSGAQVVHAQGRVVLDEQRAALREQIDL